MTRLRAGMGVVAHDARFPHTVSDPPTQLASYRDVPCLLTGGAGFIGSNLARQLLALGARVTVLDDFSTGKREHLPVDGNLEVVAADLRTYPDLAGLVALAAVVFHLAAQVGNVKSTLEAESDAQTNILASLRLFRACRDVGVRRVVYSSSSATFGEADALPIGEDHPQRPASFYALSKLTAERYALLAHELWGVPTVCLRYFNVYGLPIEDSEYTGVIALFLQCLLAGRPLAIYGDGAQVRDFVFVDDVVRANLLAGLHGVPGRAYNIGSGEATDVLTLAHTLADLTGCAPRLEHLPARAGEVRRSLADTSRARTELGYVPRWPLREGLKALWQALVTNGQEG